MVIVFSPFYAVSALLAVVVFLAILILTAIAYNLLVSRRNQANNAFSSVDVMLKKRHDLIPNLVATVKGYMEHERNVLTEITELRAKALSPDVSNNERIDVENQLSASLRSLFLVAENYPNLKASENFLSLQASLTDLEEEISASRRAYNASVVDYNNAVQLFPLNIAASLMGFKPMKFFETLEIERKTPEAPKEFMQENDKKAGAQK
jgi:LemA protein